MWFDVFMWELGVFFRGRGVCVLCTCRHRHSKGGQEVGYEYD